MIISSEFLVHMGACDESQAQYFTMLPLTYWEAYDMVHNNPPPTSDEVYAWDAWGVELQTNVKAIKFGNHTVLDVFKTTINGVEEEFTTLVAARQHIATGKTTLEDSLVDERFQIARRDGDTFHPFVDASLEAPEDTYEYTDNEGLQQSVTGVANLVSIIAALKAEFMLSVEPTFKLHQKVRDDDDGFIAWEELV